MSRAGIRSDSTRITRSPSQTTCFSLPCSRVLAFYRAKPLFPVPGTPGTKGKWENLDMAA